MALVWANGVFFNAKIVAPVTQYAQRSQFLIGVSLCGHSQSASSRDDEVAEADAALPEDQ